MNKATGIAMVALWGAALAAPAQVEISWTLANGRTVLMEPIRATVRIANYSGKNLDLSPRGNAKLLFDVEDRPSSTLPFAGQPLVKNALVVPASETREVEVDLLDGYRIVQGQTYTVTPVLEFAGMRFFGSRQSLEVQPGIELLKRDYGLASAGTARTVSLRLINRDRNDRIFFRIDDPASGYCLGVYELGRVIRFFVPRLEQDRDGRFHVLHQSAPDRFVHSTFDYDGRPQAVAFFAAETGSIRLVRDEAGAVAVAGGSPFEADPDNPGMLVAPAPPPAQPYTLDTRKLTAKERPALPEKKRGQKTK